MTDTRLTDTADATAPSLDVRLIRPEEYEEVGRITFAAYSHDYEISDDYAAQLLHPEERLSEYEVWVAEDRATGEILGTVSTLRPGFDLDGRLRDGELYFRLLGVSPTARRRGVGAALTEFSTGLARQRGQHTVALNSGENMLGAHALYLALGFRRDEERDVHFDENGRNFTVYTFTRPLDGFVE